MWVEFGVVLDLGTRSYFIDCRLGLGIFVHWAFGVNFGA